MRASLTVLSGPFAGQTIAVSRGKLVFGREVDCHVRLESSLVSRHHCVLLLDEYTLRVRDLGSRNGTLVNSRRIGLGDTILITGDVVSVGDTTCKVDLVETADEAVLPAVPPQALEKTGVFEGDTVPGDAVPGDAPKNSAPSVAPQTAKP